jgi:transposase
MLCGMSKSFRPYDQHQLLLFPPNLQDLVPENHVARFVSEVVDSLDLSYIFAVARS